MFLATTSLEEFWDLNQKKILAAGEWCRLYNKKYSVELDTLPYIWSNVGEVHKAQLYCNRIYESSLLSLTESLNSYLGINKEVHYYRILAGAWLFHFIHQAYDKYKVLDLAIKSGATYTWSLEKEQYYYPYDYKDYQSKTDNNSDNDLYQLQLFSQVVKYVRINSLSKKSSLPLIKKQDSPIITDLGSIKRTVKNFTKSAILHLFNFVRLKKKVVVVSPYIKRHSFIFMLLLSLKSFNRLTWDQFNYTLRIKSKPVDLDFRMNEIDSTGPFESWVAKLALQNIPQCYLEYHHDYIKLIKELYPNKGNIFITFNALYGNVPFQFFLANGYKDQIIASGQHGCGYGMDAINDLENFERSISHRFFTYGWSDSKETKPLPMPKLTFKISKSSDDILFLSHLKPRYIIRFYNGPTCTKNLKDHVEFPLIFIRELDNLESLIIRHRSLPQRDWHNRERIHSEFPNIREDKNISFYKSLGRCKIFVSDHLGTTFLESMQANIPSIIFINKSSYIFRREFIPFVNALQQEEILFYDPKLAAKHLNSVKHNLDSWWKRASLQDVRAKFVNTYALTSDNWMDEWIKEFFGIVKL